LVPLASLFTLSSAKGRLLRRKPTPNPKITGGAQLSLTKHAQSATRRARRKSRLKKANNKETTTATALPTKTQAVRTSAIDVPAVRDPINNPGVITIATLTGAIRQTGTVKAKLLATSTATNIAINFDQLCGPIK
jgi:hypothetical protein